MKVVETSFLVDYLNEQPYTLAYLEAHLHAEYVIPTVALYELYAGALRSAGAETIGTITDALEWAEPVVCDDPAAREAADIRSTLLDRGEPIPAPDILIAVLLVPSRPTWLRLTTISPVFLGSTFPPPARTNDERDRHRRQEQREDTLASPLTLASLIRLWHWTTIPSAILHSKHVAQTSGLSFSILHDSPLVPGETVSPLVPLERLRLTCVSQSSD